MAKSVKNTYHMSNRSPCVYVLGSSIFYFDILAAPTTTTDLPVAYHNKKSSNTDPIIFLLKFGLRPENAFSQHAQLLYVMSSVVTPL
jgi:hypothetical protein